MNESINNLYGFYHEIGKSNAASVEENPDFSVISAENAYWPQMIFNINLYRDSNLQPEQKLAWVMQQAKQNFAVCDASNFTTYNQSFLRKSGIFPVKTWLLMEISLNKSPIIREQPNVEFRELKLRGELDQFCNLTNAELMGTSKIDSAFIHKLAESPKVKLYGLYIQNELVSILLSFAENGINGLYFIATKSRYQGKKLAEYLIKQVSNLLFMQKTEKVVLQAVQKAVPLYTRIGFKPCGKLTIFWKQ